MDRNTIQYPYMMFKHPGPEEIHGSKFATNIVQSEGQLENALEDGWQLTTYDALKVVGAPIPAAIRDEGKRTAYHTEELVKSSEDPEAPKETPPMSSGASATTKAIPDAAHSSVGKPVNWKK